MGLENLTGFITDLDNSHLAEHCSEKVRTMSDDINNLGALTLQALRNKKPKKKGKK